MPKPSSQNAQDYISPLEINGLQGRMLHMPAIKTNKREILFVYGHHASLERYWGIMQDLNDYGTVTMPDLPGFGGMDSFNKLGQKPTIDNFADYLATFIKLRYRRKHVTIIGFSMGFVIATRMLQLHPDLAKKVDLLISGVGFTHHEDFRFTKNRYNFYLWMAKIFQHYLPSLFFKFILLNPFVLRRAYSKTHNAKEKFSNLSKTKHQETLNFELHLWKCNDVRTWLSTTVEMLKLDNCKVKVKLPVWHIAVKNDRYLNNHHVEQHMRIIFEDFHQAKSSLKNHGPSLILTKSEARPILPPKIRQLLSERV